MWPMSFLQILVQKEVNITRNYVFVLIFIKLKNSLQKLPMTRNKLDKLLHNKKKL